MHPVRTHSDWIIKLNAIIKKNCDWIGYSKLKRHDIKCD